MSKYTTELRWIAETYAGPEVKGVDNIINAALPHIFNFTFPLYDESHRTELEFKIVLHYYFREIALETVELWRTFLHRKLLEIMPYYNTLYESADN